MRKLVQATAALAVSTLASVAMAQGPNPHEITIAGINYGGTGCPIGSANYTLAQNAQSFTLLFDEYLAEKGPNIPRSESRKFCQVTVDLRIPHGWQYHFFKVDYRGFANLDAGVKGVLRASYYFQGQSRDAVQTTVINGPYDAPYKVTDNMGVETIVWSPCVVVPVNIKTDVSVSARGNREGVMSVDSIDGSFKQTFFMQWRRTQGCQ